MEQQVLHILHEDDYQAMKKVRANPFGLFRVLRLFEQVQFRRAIQGLLHDTAADILLEARFHHIGWIAVPRDLLSVARGENGRHGCVLFYRRDRFNFLCPVFGRQCRAP